MKRRYRVRENKRFQEIRRSGRSHANELLVLCALPNDLPYSRYGFSVSSRIGNAVTRNRIKRRVREAVRLRMDSIVPGWDIVFIARNPIRSADYHAMDNACARLLRRAHLLLAETGSQASPKSQLPDLVIESTRVENGLGSTRTDRHPLRHDPIRRAERAQLLSDDEPAGKAQATLPCSSEVPVDTTKPCES